MIIRKANCNDIPDILILLSQVLEIHANIRPDIFIHGTTKYSGSELEIIFQNEETPVYVAVNEQGKVIGYAFCQLQNAPFSSTMIPYKSFYIDDLCISEEVRGQGVGKALFEYAVKEAKRLGCFEVTLNVWEGNDPAKRFYEKMGMKPKETQMELIL